MVTMIYSNNKTTTIYEYEQTKYIFGIEIKKKNRNELR